jgi:hypothetical protein
MLEHNSHEGGIVTSGALEITVGDQVKILRSGDAYLFNSRIPHRFCNVGDEVFEVSSAPALHLTSEAPISLVARCNTSPTSTLAGLLPYTILGQISPISSSGELHRGWLPRRFSGMRRCRFNEPVSGA